MKEDKSRIMSKKEYHLFKETKLMSIEDKLSSIANKHYNRIQRYKADLLKAKSMRQKPCPLRGKKNKKCR